MTVKLTVGADADGHLLALRSRIVADAGGYHTTSAKCALRAACHSCGVYRVPNVDVEARAVYTNNPNAGAMRGFGSNQAQFAMEGIMDMLAEKVGVDGWDIRERTSSIPATSWDGPGHARERARHSRDAQCRQGRLQEGEVKASGAASRAPGSATARSKAVTSRSVCAKAGASKSSTATPRWARVSTATMQAVCEETHLPPDIMTVSWDKELGEKCGVRRGRHAGRR